jgi:hypothetical protein
MAGDPRPRARQGLHLPPRQIRASVSEGEGRTKEFDLVAVKYRYTPEATCLRFVSSRLDGGPHQTPQERKHMCPRYVSAALVLALVASATAVAAPPLHFGYGQAEMAESERDVYLSPGAVTKAVSDGLLEAGVKLDFDSHTDLGISFDYQQLYSSLPQNHRIRLIAAQLQLYVRGAAMGKKERVALCQLAISSWNLTGQKSDEAQAAVILTDLRQMSKDWATRCPYVW